MADQTPKWHYVADVVIKSLALLGAMFAYTTLSKPTAEVQNLSTKIDTALKEQTKEFDLKLKESESRRSVATAGLAEIELQRSTEPLLSVKPVIDETPSYYDVRGLQFQAQFTNVGLHDLVISRIDMEVFNGRIKNEAGEIIERAQKIAQCLEVLAQKPTSDEDKIRQEEVRKALGELRKNCPHGRVFQIGPESKDIEWNRLDDLYESRLTNLTLRPQQIAFEKFDYLLTQSLALHYGWTRLVLTVNRGEETAQTFAFVVPMRYPPTLTPGEYKFASYAVCQPSIEERGETFRWAPDASLIPRAVTPNDGAPK